MTLQKKKKNLVFVDMIRHESTDHYIYKLSIVDFDKSLSVWDGKSLSRVLVKAEAKATMCIGIWYHKLN